MQIQAKIVGILYDRCGKPGSNYPDLEPGKEFRNWVRVLSSDYKSLMMMMMMMMMCMFVIVREIDSQLWLWQDCLNEWANMTGFLCALGSVCLQNKSHRASMAAVLGVDSRKSSVLPGCSDQQYCPVTMSVFVFIHFHYNRSYLHTIWSRWQLSWGHLMAYPEVASWLLNLDSKNGTPKYCLH